MSFATKGNTMKSQSRMISRCFLLVIVVLVNLGHIASAGGPGKGELRPTVLLLVDSSGSMERCDGGFPEDPADSDCSNGQMSSPISFAWKLGFACGRRTTKSVVHAMCFSLPLRRH